MSKFIFKFDQIIRIKVVLEKKILKEISLIDREIENSINKKKSFIDKKKNLYETITSGQIRIYEFKSASAHIKTIEKEISNIDKKIMELEHRKEQKQSELIQKKKELKTFETLKENKMEEFLFDSSREELKQMNEIAISNFIRKG
ncbi:MAG TPA: flagellar FliJ family protein [Melioribacteraceae bacterium]|nr:flagellar FliJ family protein [Melioribacteraceae bacterium]